jgi:hypothetical protein
MDLFSRTCLDLGSSFILIKKGLIISSTGWPLRIIFAAVLLLIGQKFVKDSKRKWKFIAMTSMFGTFPFSFRYSAN